MADRFTPLGWVRQLLSYPDERKEQRDEDGAAGEPNRVPHLKFPPPVPPRAAVCARRGNPMERAAAAKPLAPLDIGLSVFPPIDVDAAVVRILR